MSASIISVRGIGKKYRLGAAASQDTLRDHITHGLKALFGAEKQSGKNLEHDFWALRDVTFDIPQGEVVGVVGRNGAGKSTLLKILSQITEPTEGEIRIRGRVASLLEVGTGFHPELSGRENIFLNGAILGMSKAEIKRKFDEIVAFAEVDKFLDTPVKRYSSGMYVRLAFAVAAHLEPEILIVDEVLAVGDALFQSKCLAKMDDIAQGGRTVLFVSHNLHAVQSLCDSAMLFDSGRLIMKDQVRTIVSAYLASGGESSYERTWTEQSAPGSPELKLLAVRALSEGGNGGGQYASRNETIVEIEFNSLAVTSGLCVGFDLVTLEGETVFRSFQTDSAPEEWVSQQIGLNRWRCHIPSGLLNYGTYFVCPRIGVHNVSWIVNIENVIKFSVILDHGVSPYWNSIRSKKERPGITSPILKWTAN